MIYDKSMELNFGLKIGKGGGVGKGNYLPLFKLF
tara:strand:+ start:241 stop:342 length:102 start_codon:yes stop_codon:yes gene_type:complete